MQHVYWWLSGGLGGETWLTMSGPAYMKKDNDNDNADYIHDDCSYDDDEGLWKWLLHSTVEIVILMFPIITTVILTVMIIIMIFYNNEYQKWHCLKW